jgi:hypothetical protein
MNMLIGTRFAAILMVDQPTARAEHMHKNSPSSGHVLFIIHFPPKHISLSAFFDGNIVTVLLWLDP